MKFNCEERIQIWIQYFPYERGIITLNKAIHQGVHITYFRAIKFAKQISPLLNFFSIFQLSGARATDSIG